MLNGTDATSGNGWIDGHRDHRLWLTPCALYCGLSIEEGDLVGTVTVKDSIASVIEAAPEVVEERAVDEAHAENGDHQRGRVLHHRAARSTRRARRRRDPDCGRRPCLPSRLRPNVPQTAKRNRSTRRAGRAVQT